MCFSIFALRHFCIKKSRCKSAKIRSPAGFTYFELLVVLVLLSLATALVVPRVAVFLERKERFFSKVEDFLLATRIKSLVLHQNLLLVVDPVHRALLVFRAKDFPEGKPLATLSVPENVEVRQKGLVDLGEGRVGVVFFAEGYFSGGELEILDQSKGTSRVFLFPQSQMSVLSLE